MFAQASPEHADQSETQATLGFAMRAGAIEKGAAERKSIRKNSLRRELSHSQSSQGFARPPSSEASFRF